MSIYPPDDGIGVWPAWWTVGGGQWPYVRVLNVLVVHFAEQGQLRQEK